MKTLKFIFYLSLFCVGFTNAFAQVETRFFPEGDALSGTRFENLLQRRSVTDVKKMAAFDASALLLEDSIIQADHNGDVPFRFGKDFSVNYSLNNGVWDYMGEDRVWSLSFRSDGAYSLNFIFDDFYLPQGAELYIVNEDRTMRYGPVTAAQNPENGRFLTDLVAGDNVTLYLYEPGDKIGQSTLTVSKVVHAYRDLYASASTQLGCYNNVSCYPDYDLESKAVAVILLSNGNSLCSGSLIMTANKSFDPYFLTAFHCLDTNPYDGSLSSGEKSAVNNWMFKFNYKQTCSGNTTVAQTYNGSSLMAALFDSDFALLKMNKNPSDDVAWLGWDRRNTAATSGALIHHPAGDYMKISFENDPVSLYGQICPWSNGYVTLYSSPNTHWEVDLDNGAMERGSSGSPFLNQEKRVIGQLHGGDIFCPPNAKSYMGAFHYSWDHSSSPSEQLKCWLDPTNTGAETTNTYLRPSIQGDKILCGAKTYTLYNAPLETITWSVTGDLAIVSGQGSNQVTLKVALVDWSGRGVITATAASGLSVSYDVYATSPTVERIAGPQQVNLNQNNTYTAEPFVTDIYYSLDFEWSVTPSAEVMPVSSDPRSCNIRFTSPGTYTIQCRSKTSCGYQPGGATTLTVTTSGARYAISQKERQLTITPFDDLQQRQSAPTYAIYELTSGKLEKTGTVYSTTTVDLSNSKAGFYLVKIKDSTYKIVLQ